MAVFPQGITSALSAHALISVPAAAFLAACLVWTPATAQNSARSAASEERGCGDMGQAAAPAGPEPLSITYFGTSTLMFSDGRSRLLFDGFFSRPRLRNPFAPLASLDSAVVAGLGDSELPIEAILVAHAHHDHAMDVAAVARREVAAEAVVVGTPSVRRLATAQDVVAQRVCSPMDEENMVFGPFRVQAFRVRHGPAPWPLSWILDQPLSHDFAEPAWFGAYKDDENLSFLIEHGGHRILVHPSAGSRDSSNPNAEVRVLSQLNAQVVFLGMAQIGRMSSSRADEYFWNTLGPDAEMVVPIHWDTFMTPVETPLQPVPWPIDNIERGFERLCDYAARRIRPPVVLRLDMGEVLSLGQNGGVPDVRTMGTLCDSEPG